MRTGTATLQVDDVRAAAEALEKLAEKHGGFLESEQIGSGQLAIPMDGGYNTGIVPPSQGDGWVTLRVPSADLPVMLPDLRGADLAPKGTSPLASEAARAWREVPCPACGDIVREVSFAEKSFQYCPGCQTGGKVLADRRMSRLLK